MNLRGVWPRWATVVAVLILAVAPLARAEFKIPALTGPVVDEAGILDRSTESALTSALTALHTSGRSQINVLTLSSLEGLPIEQASIRVVDQWKLGGREKDNGVLLLVAPNDRRVRIEVGQGLEGVLTDADSKRIIDGAITPLFRTGDYGSGVLVGVYQIAQKTDPSFDLEPYLEGRARARATSPSGGSKLRPMLILAAILLLILFGGGGRRSRRRTFAQGMMTGWGMSGGGWSGRSGSGWGGGGGSSWGGGGGGFSGGGASGGW